MAELLTAVQMRAVEEAAISKGSVTGLELMERAGKSVVAAICETWPDLGRDPGRALVLCGPGNNGGDGFVIARLLHDRGWQVSVAALGDREALPPDARANADRWDALGPSTSLADASFGAVPPDLAIDALFGTGLTRPVAGDAATALGHLDRLRQDFGVKCVAVDLPSGVCSDSGKVLGVAPTVDLTVSFHTEKLGHRLGPADAISQRIVVKDIGLPHGMEGQGARGAVSLVEAPAPGLLRKSSSGQKYSHGHAAVLSGASGRTGAARLAARGALRIGAGLVTLGVPPEAMAEAAAQVTALMLEPVADADDLARWLADPRLSAICAGPGLGLDARARSLVETVLSLRRPTVLDADALTLFRDDPGALFSRLHDSCVLTPHGGEFARLFPDLAERLSEPALKGPAFSKVDAARAAARRAGCILLFKGPDTVIAAPDGRCALHSAQYQRAAPWLATAGAGDVLAGFITGLMARGIAPMRAAETGAWLHVACALTFGPGLIAEDLPEQVPGVLRSLEG